MIALPPFATMSHPVPGYPVLEIRHPSCEARIALHGAHILEWTPAGQQPVLYLSPQAEFRQGAPIRGGIPVCWPWFGPHADDPSKPAHGFARVQPWELLDCDDEGGCVSLRLVLKSNDETRALWPHDFVAFLEIRAGHELTVSLVTHNSGTTTRAEGGALHTYLATGEIDGVRVLGLDGAAFRDSLASGMRHIQEGALAIDREIDRLYEPAGDVTVTDPGLGRRLIVHRHGAPVAVVWNPWIEKSKRLGDLPDDDYHQFLCVEAAVPPAWAVEVPPGGTLVLRTRVKVQAL